MILRMGIDSGSTTTKTVVLSPEGLHLSYRIVRTGHDALGTATTLRDAVLNEAASHLGEQGFTVRSVATGYGRALIDFVDRSITEITCHAAGIHSMHPEARTIIDIGGQDSKAIRLGPDGKVEDFAMNDRCAAGTGSFLDVIAGKFNRKVEDLSFIHKNDPVPLEVSSTCVVFAESEVVGLIAKGNRVDDVLAGIHRAIAKRVVTMARQVKPKAPVFFSGGVGKNETMRRAIETELGLPVTRAKHPQLAGAIGAAILAS